MRKSITLFLIFFFSCPCAAPSFAAGPAKIRFVQAVYDDEKEVGLRYPEGVACTDDSFIVADTGNNRLVKYTFQNKVAKVTELDMPVNVPIVVQINSRNEIYTLDGRDRRILIFNSDGTEKEYLSPKGAPVSKKMVPRSFTIDQNDKIYVLDILGKVVLILDPEGNYLKHIPLPENAGYISDLAVDKQGAVFLVDSADPAVYLAAPDNDNFSPLTKDLKEYVNFPTNITLDSSGIIYLIDKHGGNLALIGRNGSFLGHRFGYGWKDSQFFYPAQLCISEGGNFFIADRGNSRIQIFISEE